MLRLALTLILLLAPVASLLAGPAEAVAAAATDAAGLARSDPSGVKFVRYLSLYAVPVNERPEFLQVLNFQVNSLSREAVLKAPLAITPDLVRVDLRDYGWKRATWEKFLDAPEPYFHAPVQVTLSSGDKETWPGGVDKSDGKYYPAGRYTVAHQKTVIQQAQAPWVDPVAAALLVKLTQSQVPVVRADWFFVQTAVEENRKAGYYAFLGLTKRADFELLVGLDVKAAQRVRREVASILRKSGVSRYPRQVFRYGAIDAGAWRSLDALNSTVGDHNAVSNLDDDYKHDAEEHYAFLPNRLFAYYLSKADGTQQDKAPPEIGPDTTSTSNDGNIQVMLSCVRCHREGLRPLKDYARKLFTAQGLQDPDADKARRLQQLYLGPLQKLVDRDVNDFADTLLELNGPGWTIALNAAAYGRVWKRWNDDDVTVADAARELDTTPEKWLAALAAYKRATGSVNLVLGDFLDPQPDGVVRDHWAEQYAPAQTILKGYAPVGAEVHP